MALKSSDIYYKRILLPLLLLFMTIGKAPIAASNNPGSNGICMPSAINRNEENNVIPPNDSVTVRFKVAGFKVLPNDVSAFITPVKDLNDEACALVKVVASHDFAFSSPLGIVKRKDKVGEIWLYMPRGTRQITIKHPQWGVLRNYRLPYPLESHVTYEMAISEPEPSTVLERDTIILTKTIIDTVAIKKTKPRLPLAIHTLFTASLHENGPSWGLMVAIMRRHGIFVHATTDFKSTGDTRMTCDEAGYITDRGTIPYYTGETRHSNWAVTAGAIHKIWRTLCLFEGVGYGKSNTTWQLADSEGGGYAFNKDLSHKGVAGEIGLMVSFAKISISASAMTIVGKMWQGCIGVGIKIR